MAEITRILPSRRASQIVVSGKLIETSGIVSELPDRDIAVQTRSVLQQLESLMQQAGADKARITRIQIWLADISDFEAMNQIYDEWIGEKDQPARACVGAQLVHPDYLIEIQATGSL